MEEQAAIVRHLTPTAVMGKKHVINKLKYHVYIIMIFIIIITLLVFITVLGMMC